MHGTRGKRGCMAARIRIGLVESSVVRKDLNDLKGD
jgi:hypothetical protein